MHTWRGIGILVIFAIIGQKEKFLTTPPSLRAGRRNAYKEDARSSRRTDRREISITCVNCVGSRYW